MQHDIVRRLQGINTVRGVAVLASLLLSWLAVFLNDAPNNDTFTYLRTADILINEGLPAAFQHYPWAFLSALMAGLHQLTGLSLLSSAYVLNAALFALLTLAFVNLVATLSASTRITWLAALVILCFPHLNEFRAYVIRDTGFLAFGLIALHQLILYGRRLRLRHAAGFLAAGLAGAAFRPELLAFMLVAPASLLMTTTLSEYQRRRAFLRLVLLGLAVAAGLLAAMAILPFSLSRQLMNFLAIYQPFLLNLSALFEPDLVWREAVFGEYAAQFTGDYAGWFMVAGLLAMLLACIVDSLGLVVTALLLVGFYRGYVRIDQASQATVATWLLTALMILVVYVLLTRFITTRYTLMLSVTLLVFVPFILDRIWIEARAANRQIRTGIISALILVYAFFDSHISFGASKDHLYEAAQWIRDYARPDEMLITNEILVAYETGRVVDYDRVSRDLDAETLRNAPPGSVIAVTPRPAFAELLQIEQARGQLRLMYTAHAERGADLLIFEKR